MQMRNERGGTMVVDLQNNPYHHHHEQQQQPQLSKFASLVNSKSGISSASSSSSSSNKNINTNNDTNVHGRDSSASTTSLPTSGEPSPCTMSPWNASSPQNKSPWGTSNPFDHDEEEEEEEEDTFTANSLIGSIEREEGHIYSLAASGDLLYTGSDSKNIRVWKNLKDYGGFKSKSGLVKGIVIFGNKIFTGHQDGKIRIWKVSSRNPAKHKRIGSLPTFKETLRSSVNPRQYMEVRRNRNVVKVKHFDAISTLSLNEKLGLLYSGSWDRTVKVWRISDSKCLESIEAHDDAINSVVVGFDDLVFTGSADGTVKVWKREAQAKGYTRHVLIQVLLKQENAVTALTVNLESAVFYCGSSDGVVNFWEQRKHLEHGETLRGHKMAVLCLASGGNLMFSGSADKNICVWRRGEDGKHPCLSVLTGHLGPVKCLALEEDHRQSEQGDRRWIVYSGSLDKSVKVWHVSEHAPSWREMEAPAATSTTSDTISV